MDLWHSEKIKSDKLIQTIILLIVDIWLKTSESPSSSTIEDIRSIEIVCVQIETCVCNEKNVFINLLSSMLSLVIRKVESEFDESVNSKLMQTWKMYSEWKTSFESSQNILEDVFLFEIQIRIFLLSSKFEILIATIISSCLIESEVNSTYYLNHAVVLFQQTLSMKNNRDKFIQRLYRGIVRNITNWSGLLKINITSSNPSQQQIYLLQSLQSLHMLMEVMNQSYYQKMCTIFQPLLLYSFQQSCSLFSNFLTIRRTDKHEHFDSNALYRSVLLYSDQVGLYLQNEAQIFQMLNYDTLVCIGRIILLLCSYQTNMHDMSNSVVRLHIPIIWWLYCVNMQIENMNGVVDGWNDLLNRIITNLTKTWIQISVEFEECEDCIRFNKSLNEFLEVGNEYILSVFISSLLKGGRSFAFGKPLEVKELLIDSIQKLLNNISQIPSEWLSCIMLELEMDVYLSPGVTNKEVQNKIDVISGFIPLSFDLKTDEIELRLNLQTQKTTKLVSKLSKQQQQQQQTSSSEVKTSYFDSLFNPITIEIRYFISKTRCIHKTIDVSKTQDIYLVLEKTIQQIDKWSIIDPCASIYDYITLPHSFTNLFHLLQCYNMFSFQVLFI
jgi:hypothetical protein